MGWSSGRAAEAGDESASRRCCARVTSYKANGNVGPSPALVGASGCGGAGRLEASWWGSEAGAWEPGSC